MFINKEALIKLITRDHVIKICQSLGSEYRTDSRGDLIFNTMICHENGDSWKLYYYHKPSKRFKCYTCGDSYDLIGLVLRSMALKGKNFTYFQALSYIANAIGYNETEINQLADLSVDESDIHWMRQFVNTSRITGIRHPKVLNEHILEVFSYDTKISEWENEGISENAMQKFQISYWDRHNSIIVPHRHYSDGTLIGVKERFLNPEDVEAHGKYIPITLQGETLSYPTAYNLYGLYYTREEVERVGKLVIFEAEKSVMKCESYFGEKNFTCATCGSNLSRTQIEIIRQLDIREVMLAYDKEYDDPHSFEAEAYMNKLVLLMEPLMNYFTCYLIMDGEDGILGRKDSPADAGKAGLLKLMSQKFEVNLETVKQIRRGRESYVESVS